MFLQGIGINESHVRHVLRENGYDDDSYFAGLKEDDLRAMGFHELVDGRALVKRCVCVLASHPSYLYFFFFSHFLCRFFFPLTRRLVDASQGSKLKLQRQPIPSHIPETILSWLEYLHLEKYYENFRALGYRNTDIVLLENFSARDIKAAGILKRAHVKKFSDAIKRLGELLVQGRQPEGPHHTISSVSGLL